MKSKDSIVLASELRWCVNAAIVGRQLLYGVLRIELPGVLFGQYPEYLEGYLPWSPDVQIYCK